MARLITPFTLAAADHAALENFARTGSRPVRAVTPRAVPAGTGDWYLPAGGRPIYGSHPPSRQ